MDPNFIRSLIFLTAGLIVILFPKKVETFQTFVLDKLHIKYNLQSNRRSNYLLGIAFIIIAVILFVFAMFYG